MWFYRALHAHLERELMVTLRDGLAEPSVLDAGCGTGGFIRRMEPRHPNWRWTGIDLEPLACEFAAARSKGTIVRGSLLALPFPDAAFDAVICSDVLYHLDDDQAALKELYRVLRSGGTLVVNVPAHRWLWSYHDVTVHGRRRYERAGLNVQLKEAGFNLRRMTHWNTLPLPLVYIRRKLLPAPASGSDVRLYPQAIEAAFSAGAAVERWWLRKIGNLPIGSSILATATKPGGTPHGTG